MKQEIRVNYGTLPQYPDCKHAVIDTKRNWEKTDFTTGEVELIPFVRCGLKMGKHRLDLCISVNEIGECPDVEARDAELHP